jgi:hypothetical protein
MTYSIINTNLLNTNNLIFGGLVLTSSVAVYLLGYTCSVGYNYYYSKPSLPYGIKGADPNISYAPSVNDSGSSTPKIPEIFIDSASPTATPYGSPRNRGDTVNILIDDLPLNELSLDSYGPDYLSGKTYSPYNPSSPVSTLPDNLIFLKSDASTQTEDHLLHDLFNKMLNDMMSDTNSVSYASIAFVGSPASPSVKISSFLQSLPSNKGVQTVDLIDPLALEVMDLADFYLLMI